MCLDQVARYRSAGITFPRYTRQEGRRYRGVYLCVRCSSRNAAGINLRSSSGEFGSSCTPPSSSTLYRRAPRMKHKWSGTTSRIEIRNQVTHCPLVFQEDGSWDLRDHSSLIPDTGSAFRRNIGYAKYSNDSGRHMALRPANKMGIVGGIRKCCGIGIFLCRREFMQCSHPSWAPSQQNQALAISLRPLEVF